MVRLSGSVKAALNPMARTIPYAKRGMSINHLCIITFSPPKRLTTAVPLAASIVICIAALFPAMYVKVRILLSDFQNRI